MGTNINRGILGCIFEAPFFRCRSARDWPLRGGVTKTKEGFSAPKRGRPSSFLHQKMEWFTISQFYQGQKRKLWALWERNQKIPTLKKPADTIFGTLVQNLGKGDQRRKCFQYLKVTNLKVIQCKEGGLTFLSKKNSRNLLQQLSYST